MVNASIMIVLGLAGRSHDLTLNRITGANAGRWQPIILACTDLNMAVQHYET